MLLEARRSRQRRRSFAIDLGSKGASRIVGTGPERNRATDAPRKRQQTRY
jgi:hypothetical protein